jgi:hypothetical protein
MECNRFIDEKIGETDSPAFREHRAGCEGCARDLEELAEVRSIYRAASRESYRGGVPQVRRSNRVAWIPMAAAAVLMVAVLVLVLSGPGTVAPPKVNAEAPVAFTARVYLEPWATDLRWSHALDDCWSRLERLEGSQR